MTAGCIAMIIEITSGGGFAGIGAGGVTKRIDVDAQAEPVRQELCEAFEAGDLMALEARSQASGAADMTTYRITVTGEDAERRTYSIREDYLPPETLDLIDQM